MTEPSTLKISVAICTCNRSGLLDKTLTEMRKLEIPPGLEWELLIVNNNCTDNTDEVIARHAGALPIRRLFEPKPGLSNGRNCAVAAARGELLVWTDDDVLVDPRWLAEYAQGMELWPSASFFGGLILPWFEQPTPSWLRHVHGGFASRDLGPEPIECTKQLCPYGANYAVRIGPQRRYPYDPALGRRGDRLLSSEETEVLRAMLSDGLSGRWLPEAKVSHFIPRSRQTLTYLWRYRAGFGTTLAIMERNLPITSRLWRKGSAAKHLLINELRAYVGYFTGRGEPAVVHFMRFAQFWGYFWG